MEVNIYSIREEKQVSKENGRKMREIGSASYIHPWGIELRYDDERFVSY